MDFIDFRGPGFPSLWQPVAACGGMWQPVAPSANLWDGSPSPYRRIAQSCCGLPDGDDKNDDADDDEDEGVDSWDF